MTRAGHTKSTTAAPHTHWPRAVLDHLRRSCSRQPDESARAIFQTSTVAALLGGVYDGDMTIAELLTHGDFGLGTFNHLDGEMVVLDGVCFHLHADGSVQVAASGDRTPFAAVTYFAPTVSIPIRSPLTKDEVHTLIGANIDSGNLVHAIRITGRFASVRTRTVTEQHLPYKPLLEAAGTPQENEFHEVDGVLAGFLTPAFEQGVSVAGYHLHFIDHQRGRGGHSLDFVLTEGVIDISTSAELHVSLPRTAEFMAAALTTDPQTLDAQIHQVED
jgi:acetolactate decarboxylase